MLCYNTYSQNSVTDDTLVILSQIVTFVSVAAVVYGVSVSFIDVMFRQDELRAWK